MKEHWWTVFLKQQVNKKIWVRKNNKKHIQIFSETKDVFMPVQDEKFLFRFIIEIDLDDKYKNV